MWYEIKIDCDQLIVRWRSQCHLYIILLQGDTPV